MAAPPAPRTKPTSTQTDCTRRLLCSCPIVLGRLKCTLFAQQHPRQVGLLDASGCWATFTVDSHHWPCTKPTLLTHEWGQPKGSSSRSKTTQKQSGCLHVNKSLLKVPIPTLYAKKTTLVSKSVSYEHIFTATQACS